MAYDRTQLAEDDIATASATVRNNLNKTANMVMVDFGIPPGFDLLSEDLQDYQEKSASRNAKSGHLSKFSLTATRAILYFDSFAPGDTVTVSFRLRAKYPLRARREAETGERERAQGQNVVFGVLHRDNPAVTQLSPEQVVHFRT